MAPKSSPKSKIPDNPHFKPGSVVEVSSNDFGFRGSWYMGTIIRRASTKDPRKYLVQYEKLFKDEAGKKPLREILDFVQLRPAAPREKERKFKFSEEVDAYHNDGWWEGVITEDHQDGKFSVFFKSTKEQIVFGEEDLRLHREWIDGKWKPPLEEQGKELESEEEKVLATAELKSSEAVKQEESELQKPHTTEVKPTEVVTEEMLIKGMLVEVTSDEEGFEGAWFTATIVDAVGKDKFLIQYENLRTEDDTDILREEVDTLHIRPRPPETIVIDRFKLLDEVDALYNDGWWVGVISKVLADSRYTVYFKDAKEEMVFQHSELRLHQDWINGTWVMASGALNL